jgi:hypothetical protein
MQCAYNFRPNLTKPEFSQQILLRPECKISQKSLQRERTRTDGRTDGQRDMTKLPVAFRNVANESKNWTLLPSSRVAMTVLTMILTV